ncbi:glycosyltransferase [Gordonia sp. PDNC005]|uniref:glycosyltransferase n=1 Tax=unclassified Gordonia (in: high G+C Gram-positive bacteria) TaxID=2657482 RepID=UPI001963A1C3|nr:glycosyltransferase [Gordonia sp. PDNC005]QRY61678.1 glycosyltransferase [Gordonia sp. PDNC005]
MRILQVVTLLAPGGEYGGPATVAVNQVRALVELGHDVTLVAGVRGGYRPPAVVGVDLRTFPVTTLGPGRSFTRICAPTMLRWLAAHGGEFDVAHVHMGRDLVSGPAARILVGRVATHVQTHGMVKPKNSPVHRVLDAVITRPVLHNARTVFCLNAAERSTLCAAVGDDPTFRRLTNGVPEVEETDRSTFTPPEVLFLARLHERKRPAAFVEAALDLARDHRASFTVVGPDEGEASVVDGLLDAARADGVDRVGTVSREPAVDAVDVLDRMSRAEVYVLPARREPLGVSVLEAMSVGVPVIVTDSCGAARVIAEADAGTVVDEDLTTLTSAIAEMLDDLELARDRGRRARRAVVEFWGARTVAQRLADRYAGDEINDEEWT